MADNKVYYGLDNVYIAFKTDSGYDTPIHVPGAVTLTTSAEGNQDVFYADNIPYVTFSTNSGYTGDIEFAYVPDAGLAEMYGWEIDNNGALVENSTGIPKSFALLYQVMGDQKARRCAFYNVSASRPGSSNSTTTESTDPDTQTLNVTMIPAQFTEGNVTRNVTKVAIERTTENATVYDGWFSEVYTPDFSS